jgi:hypothetical protein
MYLAEILQNSPLQSYSGALDFLVRLYFSFVTVFILVRFIFYPNNGQKELIFTYVIVGLVVFLIASVLNRVKIEFAMAIGMFAVFSILRYRTPPFEIKEMTYLFAVIGISVINALVESKINEWVAFLIADVLLILTAWFLEKYSPRRSFSKKQLSIIVSDLQVISKNQLLVEEIRNQTGLDIFKVEVTKISAAKKEVTAWIYFR